MGAQIKSLYYYFIVLAQSEPNGPGIKAKGRSATEKGEGATITVMPLHYFLFFAYKGLISSQILCFPGGHVL